MYTPPYILNQSVLYCMTHHDFGEGHVVLQIGLILVDVGETDIQSTVQNHLHTMKQCREQSKLLMGITRAQNLNSHGKLERILNSKRCSGLHVRKGAIKTDMQKRKKMRENRPTVNLSIELGERPIGSMNQYSPTKKSHH